MSKDQNTSFMDTNPFEVKNPFDQSTDSVDENTTAPLHLHLRVQQRNARQRITTVQGFPQDFDCKALLKAIKKKLCCNGAVLDRLADDDTRVLKFSGDQRQEIVKYLVDNGVAEKRHLTVHGY